MDATLNGPFGRVSLVNSALTIGRLADNQLVIADPRASSHHAEIRPTNQGYTIVDLASTNGTFVNEQRLAPNVPRQLNAGDVIRVGDMSFTYEVSGVFQVEPTIYSNIPVSGPPASDPTIAAPPPTTYGPPAQNEPAFQAPPPVYGVPPIPNYAPQQGYVPPVQPGYPPPVLPGYPGYGTPPPQKKSRKGLWITLSIIAAVLILGCGGLTVLGIVAAGNASTPTKTLDVFCQSLMKGDTKTAHQQFSASLQSQLSEDRFAVLINADKVASCTHGDPTESGSSATADLTLVHDSGVTNSDRVILTKNSDGDWKISNLTRR